MSVLDDFLNKGAEKAKQLKETIQYMLDDEESYGYANNTLRGIYKHIDAFGTVTKAQEQAIINIHSKPSNPNGKFNRRY